LSSIYIYEAKAYFVAPSWQKMNKSQVMGMKIDGVKPTHYARSPRELCVMSRFDPGFLQKNKKDENVMYQGKDLEGFKIPLPPIETGGKGNQVFI
jgi:hypothetical protein